MPSLNEPMPEWAIAPNNGALVAGTQLCTRDGRCTGNAHIILVYLSKYVENELLYEVLTDAGNVVVYTEKEIHKGFYPSEWISDVAEVINKFGRKT